MPQPSLDGSGMKDISDGLHTINTVQCLQLSGQLKPSPPLDSDLSDTDLASAPGSHHTRVTVSSHHRRGSHLSWPLVNKCLRIQPASWSILES